MAQMDICAIILLQKIKPGRAMENINLKRLILEIVAILLVVGSVFAVNKLSSEEAYADEKTITWSVDLRNVKIFYSDGSTEISG
ncbi:MAG: hypothetical protein K6G03_04330, partial [Lachnospiraceae bacterium]|nr:hypothetical protein [Lachnospiraceae bacterium]